MAWGTNAWGTRTWDDATGGTIPATVVALPVPAGGVPAWGTRSWSQGANVNIPAVAPVHHDLPFIIQRRRNPTAALFSRYRRRQTQFNPQFYQFFTSEYLLWNVGVHFFPPLELASEYLHWNLGVFGVNVRDLYIPHKRWPIQRSFDTLAALQRDAEPIDTFVADLYEKIGHELSRPEFKNYQDLENYASALRIANVSSPTFGGITFTYTYDQHNIRAAAQRAVENNPDAENAQAIADHVVSRTLEDMRRKTRILLRVKHWTFNAPNRLMSIDTQPDYLSHSIDPIPFIPDDLQFVMRNIRNRMALQERTNLIKIQHWAAERFDNLPGIGVEYIYWNVGSNGTFAGPGSGLLGSGITGQPMAQRVATGRVAAARRRRGRVFWP